MRRTVRKCAAVAIDPQPFQHRRFVFEALRIELARGRGQAGALIEQIRENNALGSPVACGLRQGKPAGLRVTKDTDRDKALRDAENPLGNIRTLGPLVNRATVLPNEK